jgi:NADH dehydrogenase [ubiquinone] 1 alpha subcomplex assembly factor 6
VNEAEGKTPVSSQRSEHPELLSPVAALVRRHDRDRYQTALFAPVARREALFALYAFNYEIARVRESVTQPTLGRIRLEWWRENIAAAYSTGAMRRHLVADALGGVIREYGLTRDHFDHLIDAREADFDADPPVNRAALEAYAEGTSSRVIYLALEILGAREGSAFAAAHHVGIAFALSGLLRALPVRSAAWRPVIPVDLATRHGLGVGDTRVTHTSAEVRAVVAEIAAAAAAHLRQGRAARPGIPRPALPALLPAVIAERSLRRLARASHDPFDPVLQHADPLQIFRLAAAVLRRRV